MKQPDVVGMVLCDRIDFGAHVGQASLVNVFHAQRFSSFPAPPLDFVVYVALYDGEGEGTIELILTRLETEEDITLYKEWRALPGRGQIVNVEIKVRQCELPAPGRYVLALFFDNRILAYRYLEVFRTENAQ
jgi:hypothetical protein